VQEVSAKSDDKHHMRQLATLPAVLRSATDMQTTNNPLA
jgi:hypothetical protein